MILPPKSCHNFLDYLKLVEISTLLVLGYVEDEICFSMLNFLEFNLHIRLELHMHRCHSRLGLHLYVWLRECFGNNSSHWQSSHKRRLLSPQNVRVSGMVMFSVFVSFETWLTCSFMNPLSFHAVKRILWCSTSFVVYIVALKAWPLQSTSLNPCFVLKISNPLHV